MQQCSFDRNIVQFYGKAILASSTSPSCFLPASHTVHRCVCEGAFRNAVCAPQVNDGDPARAPLSDA